MKKTAAEKSSVVRGQKITHTIPAEFLAEMNRRGCKSNRMVKRSIQDVGFDAPPGVTYDPSNFW